MKTTITTILIIFTLTSKAQTFKNYKEYRNFEIAITAIELIGITTSVVGFKHKNEQIIYAGMIFTGLTLHYKSVVIGRNLRVTYKKGICLVKYF